MIYIHMLILIGQLVKLRKHFFLSCLPTISCGVHRDDQLKCEFLQFSFLFLHIRITAYNRDPIYLQLPSFLYEKSCKYTLGRQSMFIPDTNNAVSDNWESLMCECIFLNTYDNHCLAYLFEKGTSEFTVILLLLLSMDTTPPPRLPALPFTLMRSCRNCSCGYKIQARG